MRVLFITGEFPPMQGGVGDCTNEIAKGLAAFGVEVRVLTSQLAIDNSQLSIPNSQFAICPIIHKWDWSSLRAIARVAREFSPNVIHIQYQTGAFGMHPAINFLRGTCARVRRRWTRTATRTRTSPARRHDVPRSPCPVPLSQSRTHPRVGDTGARTLQRCGYCDE